MNQKSTDCGSTLLTPGDVASRLHVSQRQIYNLVAEGGFPPPLKVGRLNRWREVDVNGYIERLASMADSHAVA
jgi:excisionase family DNA binding protein